MNLKQSMAALLWASMVVLGEHTLEPRPVADTFEVFTIMVDNITAKFIPYGARLISLHVPDKEGTPQDVVVGYEDPIQYLNDTKTSHTYFGAVIGRIANRMKNGSFTLGGTEYNIPKNHDGLYTLHGGNAGYDQRNWTVTAHTSSSVTFALYDNTAEGFPGDIVTHATYTVDSKRTTDNPQGSPRLVTELVSLALTESTPIMPSNHIYWNLNAFKQPTILDDTWLQLPLSRRFIETDSNQIPTGVIATVEDSDHSSMDFTVGKTIGQDIQYTEGLCRPGCIGYDHCFIIDHDPSMPLPMIAWFRHFDWTPAIQGSAWRLRRISPQYRSLRV
ncbi:galactose mutarotase-like domain-containing protein [Aspergillus pseudonomiae]|uniref:Galactose mutarotase-like domain-containing protein n=1 Tax=Aspergillus pseudonomiae TaxID=1506151 RepID=A0A5N7CU61_9EURO|nr:galactose mutarotase-like domain-containing protein [Aspergillus pseudonomiae]KAE8397720.1 galactose mutarotase-like domain-containing protein [Aspergillus pseudonomiae]